MMAMSLDALWLDHMLHARWFQGKGLSVSELSIEPLEWYVHTPEMSVRSELAHCHVGGQNQTYHLLGAYCPVGQAEPEALIGQACVDGLGTVDVMDAPHSPHAMAALLGHLSVGGGGIWWLETPPNPDSTTTVFSGEQSNTTIRIGDCVLLKLFRKVSVGPNPEAAVLAALATSGITPRLIGTWSSPDARYDLGFFSQRIDQAQDGWAFCVDACRTGISVATPMHDLGQTLRRLHASMADAFGRSEVDATDISSGMLSRLDAACEQADELLEMRESLARALTLPPGPVATQRIHGDFHLGQALVSPRGWTIIDFEGEPLKSPDERIAPDAVWRDVAGLTRSLDYAQGSHPHPHSQAAQSWHSEARTAFLAGYAEGDPSPQRLLTAYEIDKAIYELIYELRNRPTWADLPRRALHRAVKAL